MIINERKFFLFLLGMANKQNDISNIWQLFGMAHFMD